MLLSRMAEEETESEKGEKKFAANQTNFEAQCVNRIFSFLYIKEGES